MIIILPNEVDGDGGGGIDDGGRIYFPTYCPSINFLFLSFLDFSPSFFLLSLFFFFFQNLRKIYMLSWIPIKNFLLLFLQVWILIGKWFC